LIRVGTDRQCGNETQRSGFCATCIGDRERNDNIIGGPGQVVRSQVAKVIIGRSSSPDQSRVRGKCYAYLVVCPSKRRTAAVNCRRGRARDGRRGQQSSVL